MRAETRKFADLILQGADAETAYRQCNFKHSQDFTLNCDEEIAKKAKGHINRLLKSHEMIAYSRNIERMPDENTVKIFKISREMQLRKLEKIYEMGTDTYFDPKKEAELPVDLSSARGAIAEQNKMMGYIKGMEEDPFANSIELNPINITEVTEEIDRLLIQSPLEDDEKAAKINTEKSLRQFEVQQQQIEEDQDGYVINKEIPGQQK